MIGVYKITSPSGRVYIGQSVRIPHRFRSYKRMECRNQTKLYRSFLKYGVVNHKFEVLEQCEIHQLDDKEIFYSLKYNSIHYKKGLNVRECGDGKKPLPESVRRKISKSNKGKIVSQETREKISTTLRGNIPWNKGKITGLVAWNKGIPPSDKTKELLRKANIGKIGDKSNAKIIQQFDTNGNLIDEFYGAVEVQRKFGFQCSSINRAARGERVTSYGFIWKYK